MEEVIDERYIIMVVVPPVISAQPLLSLIVAFTLTLVVWLAVKTIELALFRTTFVTVGAALPTITVLVTFAANTRGIGLVPLFKKATVAANPANRKMATTSAAPQYEYIFLTFLLYHREGERKWQDTHMEI